MVYGLTWAPTVSHEVPFNGSPFYQPPMPPSYLDRSYLFAVRTAPVIADHHFTFNYIANNWDLASSVMPLQIPQDRAPSNSHSFLPQIPYAAGLSSFPAVSPNQYFYEADEHPAAARPQVSQDQNAGWNDSAGPSSFPAVAADASSYTTNQYYPEALFSSSLPLPPSAGETAAASGAESNSTTLYEDLGQSLFPDAL